VGIHIPARGLKTAWPTNFLAKIVQEEEDHEEDDRKRRAASRMPPLRMMEPSGAPMRNMTRQATAMVIFSCQALRA